MWCRFWVWQDRRHQYGADRHRPHAPPDVSCHRDAGQANPRDQHPVSSEEHQEHHFPAHPYGCPTRTHDHPARCSHPENASAAIQPPAPAHDQARHRAGSAYHRDAPTAHHARFHPHARPHYHRCAGSCCRHHAMIHRHDQPHHCFRGGRSRTHRHQATIHHHDRPHHCDDAHSALHHHCRPKHERAPVLAHGTKTRPPRQDDFPPPPPTPSTTPDPTHSAPPQQKPRPSQAHEPRHHRQDPTAPCHQATEKKQPPSPETTTRNHHHSQARTKASSHPERHPHQGHHSHRNATAVYQDPHG